MCLPSGVASYFTDRGDCVELALDGRDPVDECCLEDDAVSSACEVWDLRELIQEPGVQSHKQLTCKMS